MKSVVAHCVGELLLPFELVAALGSRTMCGESEGDRRGVEEVIYILMLRLRRWARGRGRVAMVGKEHIISGVDYGMLCSIKANRGRGSHWWGLRAWKRRNRRILFG